MKLLDALQRIQNIGAPVFSTNDAAACLRVSRGYASQILRRLGEKDYLIRIKQGVWALAGDIDPLIFPEYLTAPFPAYISLQSALYYHGMIDQIPNVIYAVSPARTQRIKTAMATVSIHHIDLSFFFGYEVETQRNFKFATPEKALLDLFYLSSAKSGLFKNLPEIELPSNFSMKKAMGWIKKIKSQQKRTIATNWIERIVR